MPLIDIQINNRFYNNFNKLKFKKSIFFMMIKSSINVKIFGNNTLGFLGGIILKFFFGSIYLFANKVSPANDFCSSLTRGL